VQIDWLEGLESRVRDAVEQLAELREENGKLRETVESLETRLAAAAPTPLEDGEGGENDVLRGRVRDLERQLAEAEASTSAWQAEREDVRRRVEALTARLEGLVAG
jgi:predicted  nucleic acid-binding Zn-ribbon protein